VLSEQETRRLISLKEGEAFSREKITRSVSAITERLGEEGYALANVNPIPEVDKEKHIVNFTFYVDQGRKTYVRRINISGNYQSRDEVIRREMRQMESATYDGKKIKRSKQRIDQLGYFNEVTLDTAAVPESVDQVDINVAVTEKKTGSMNFGIGYGQSDGVILNASLNQNNFLGSGKNFSFQVSHSKSTQNYSASVVNPYATPDGISFGYNAYLSKIDPSKLGTGRYSTTALGAGFQIGLPVSDDNKMSLGFNAEELKIITSTTYPPGSHILNYINEYGSTNENYSVSLGWTRDRRDSAVFPTSGYLTQLGSNINVPGSTTQFYKLTASNQAFAPLWGRWVGAWTLDASMVRAYAGSAVPFYRNLYAGGVGSIRGYESSSLGNKDENGDPIGGDRRVVSNLELIAPFPGMKDDKSLRLGAFWDVGGVWAKGEPLSSEQLRQSVGVALTWYAPIGPIKLSYAKPIREKQGDEIESFQFQLGYVF
jgi:outer membrane protein insertion porin family